MVQLDPTTRWPLVPIKRFAQLVYGDALPAEKREDGGAVPVYGSNGAFGFHSSANTLSPVILVGRKGSVGALNWSERPAFAIDTVYFVDEVHASCDLRWLYWALQTAGLHHLSQDTGVPGLSREMAYGVALPLPPLPEQTAIAAFLDRETGKIDALVEEQKRLIELLKEKRQAVISHAVTKGLDPNARMKPSGVEWLGDVPEHWEVRRIKHLSSLISKGTTPTTIGADFTSEGVRFLKAENLSAGSVQEQPEFFISEETHQQLGRSQLRAGDVLVVIAGATTGKSAVLPSAFVPANTNQAVAFIRPTTQMDPQWINLWLSIDAVQRNIALGSVQSAQPNLAMEDLGNIPIFCPPQDEAREILKQLSADVQQLDELRNQAGHAVALLQERRSAVISAAVTGKLDVRDITKQEEAA